MGCRAFLIEDKQRVFSFQILVLPENVVNIYIYIYR